MPILNEEDEPEGIQNFDLMEWLDGGGSSTGEGNLGLVDVRDDDFADFGHIKGSLHYSVDDFEANLEKFADEIKSKKFNDIVFICMYGEMRSPSAAQLFLSYLQDLKNSDPDSFEDIDVKVWYLVGGIGRFVTEFGIDNYVLETS
ncbi:hypothetical protein PACTADRAFT_82601 [Pachysolen tannophilus NRRL Y-2460]|uniref:Rhodanese domain-containing protein n=1 Tax=Pachysolen tannophilus NRRL Y-2460 TaxID=669874 RepID=A0A1E4TNE2_PACTA|nr:hypothetical protein PACTADRAFT_82601 [Pachysolen tannophilus NRRL Y-2460]